MSAVPADTYPESRRGKGRLRRQASENALIEAFGRVVQRSGLRSVGVNEVVKEAGVGKALLYRYFGGLPGLVRAWGERNRVWPELSTLTQLAGTLEDVGAAEQIKRVVVRNADSHRQDPLRVELLAEEMMTPTPISEALSEIRQQLGQQHAAILTQNREIREHRLLLVVMMAAASYLAMRAVKAPRFMGENLAAEETWQRLMREIERIIEQAVAREADPQGSACASSPSR